jgi:hypothetical protein
MKLTSQLLRNRQTIYFGLKLAQAKDDTEREQIIGKISQTKNANELLSQI